MILRWIQNQATVVVIGFWYISLFPGRLGFDSAEAIRMIQRGESTDWWSATYFWFLRISTLWGATIALASLVQLALMFYALRKFIESLPISEHIRRRVLLISILTPLFGFFALSVSHDAFQVAGTLLILSKEFRHALGRPIVHEARTSNIFFHSTIVVSLSMSKVGLAILLAYCFVLLFRRMRLTSLLVATSTVVVFLASSIGITKQASSYYIWPLLADLKCVAQHSQPDISSEEWKWLEGIAPKDKWKKPVGCSSMDQAVESLGLHSSQHLPVDVDLFKNYLSIAAKNPAIVVMAHINRARVALPPPFFPIPDNQVDLDPNSVIGLGTNTALQSGPEVLHPSIDEPSMKVSKGFLAPLEAFVQAPALLINQASWFWGWGGMWLWLILFFFIRHLKPFSIKRLFVATWPITLIHTVLVLVSPSSLPRYVMVTILVGVMLATALALEKFVQLKSLPLH